MSATRMSDGQIEEALEQLPGWSLKDGKLHREFVFADFVHAFAFMAGCAAAAEGMNHHPEWFNVYKTVRVDLSTHEAGGVTERDIKLAGRMSRLAAGFGA